MNFKQLQEQGRSESWWIKKKQIILVDNHIGYVEDHPEYFNLTQEDINKITEDELYEIVLKDGWIRILSIVPDSWAICLDNLRRSKKDIINFIEWAMLDEKIMKADDEISIEGIYGISLENFIAKDYLDILEQKELKEQATSPIGNYLVYKNDIIPVGRDHVEFIRNDPVMFGFTPDFGGIHRDDDIYDKIMKDGWIRVHNESMFDLWMIEFYNFRKQKRWVENFIEWVMLDKKQMSPNDTVRLYSYGEKDYPQFDAKDYLQVLESKQLKEQGRSESWWIKGKQIILLKQVDHISYLFSHPKVFGLSEKDIPSEGFSAEPLVRLVLNKGWIRAGWWGNMWPITTANFRKGKKDIINFIEYALLDKKIMELNDTISIEDEYGNILKNFIVKDYLYVLEQKQMKGKNKMNKKEIKNLIYEEIDKILKEDEEYGWGYTDDGWDEDDLDDIELGEWFDEVSRLHYEIRNAVRGSYADFGSTLKDLHYHLENVIKSDLEDVIKKLGKNI